MTHPVELTATIAQCRQIIGHQLQMLWEDPASAPHVSPVMVWGAPGVGKSAVIRDLAASEGIGFIDVRLSQREPVDMRGLPVPVGDEVRWLLSSEWPRDPDSRGIILFDELTAADRMLQVAAYEFILDRRLGDLYRVPDGWLVCAAGNRSEDRAVAMTLSSALANRFCHLEVRPDLPTWVRWAYQNGLDPRVIGFLNFKPDLFFSMRGNVERGWPSPRSWERVARLLARPGTLDANARHLMISGLIGTGAAIELRAFFDLVDSGQSALALLNGTVAFREPARADQYFAICTALVYHLLRAEDRDWPVWLTHFIDIGLSMKGDFATMAMQDLIGQLQRCGQTPRLAALFGNDRYDIWSQRHGGAFGQTPEAATGVAAGTRSRQREQTLGNAVSAAGGAQP